MTCKATAPMTLAAITMRVAVPRARESTLCIWSILPYVLATDSITSGSWRRIPNMAVDQAASTEPSQVGAAASLLPMAIVAFGDQHQSSPRV